MEGRPKGSIIGLPMEKLKVHQFQISCAKTKYLLVMDKSRTIIFRVTKMFFLPIHLGLERIKCHKPVNFSSSDFDTLL